MVAALVALDTSVSGTAGVLAVHLVETTAPVSRQVARGTR